jgi:hypothetical protein
VRLFGARDPQVLLDLDRICQRDFKAKPGRDQRAGPGNSNLQNATASDRLQCYPSRSS